MWGGTSFLTTGLGASAAAVWPCWRAASIMCFSCGSQADKERGSDEDVLGRCCNDRGRVDTPWGPWGHWGREVAPGASFKGLLCCGVGVSANLA